jgi:sugar phosphate isomerase/epimerase
MKTILRRQFLQSAATGVAGAALCAIGATRLLADPLGLPIGVQLYTVKDELAKNFFLTLKRIAIIGYKEVETAGFLDKKASEWRQSLDQLGLRCPSAHGVKTTQSDDEIKATADFCKELGAEYMICAEPGLRDPKRLSSVGKPGTSIDVLMTLDDWKWNADRLNQIGELTKKAGIRLGYHNHNLEFTEYGDVFAYDELIRHTDLALVAFEMDCGWVVVAGQDPVKYLEKYPRRIQMLHIKDEKPGYKASTGKDGAPTTEVGRGSVDWKRLFTAAKEAQVKHYFVEQEPPFEEMPPLDALRVSYNFLHDLKI